nr:gfo/Idh/MocA family oxidoreductase [Pseudomonadota bacterium]
LVGRPLERVDAVGVPVLTKSVDIANARLIFEGGATANVTASRVSFKSERSMRIFQPDVYINLDFGNKKLKIFTKSSADPGATPQIGIKEMDIEERDALKDEISSFVECVKNKTKPLVSGQDGLKALLLVNKIREALNESLERFSTSSVETPVSINLN